MNKNEEFLEYLGYIALLATFVGIMFGAFDTIQAVLAVVQSIFMIYAGVYTKNHKKH